MQILKKKRNKKNENARVSSPRGAFGESDFC